MKLKKVTSNTEVSKREVNTQKELDICKENLKNELEILRQQKQKIMSLKRHIFDLENAPFTSGDEVIITLTGHSFKDYKKEEYKGILTVIPSSFNRGYELMVIPYKNDGTLSNRRIKVYSKSQLRFSYEK